nr:hypothetical protein CFP56_57062 [Quercus suber]
MQCSCDQHAGFGTSCMPHSANAKPWPNALAITSSYAWLCSLILVVISLLFLSLYMDPLCDWRRSGKSSLTCQGRSPEQRSRALEKDYTLKLDMPGYTDLWIVTVRVMQLSTCMNRDQQRGESGGGCLGLVHTVPFTPGVSMPPPSPSLPNIVISDSRTDRSTLGTLWSSARNRSTR